ncbi:hypothetical protein [Exercitatus varius]|uniref:hypothetical protein n=1 Tax=Exercitatus varius TaxID=67857 RepID=UPI00294AB4F3|nr:hypothetical protein [Exercitatus varius]MDG2941163.1 hypothetical protein [Exercitatus varius]MDG2952030.1 hypothetical protein [Exercitatus varius]
MNIEIFLKQFPLNPNKLNQKPWESLILAVQTEDIIGTVLRLHLFCEKTIEAYICGMCNQEQLLGYNLSNNDKFIIDFSIKLKMAKSIGLPQKLYKVLSKLNLIRNAIAHVKDVDIPKNHLQSAKTMLIDYLKEKDSSIHINQYGLELNNDDGSPMYKRTFGDNDLSNKDLFIVISVNVIHEIAQIAAKEANFMINQV